MHLLIYLLLHALTCMVNISSQALRGKIFDVTSREAVHQFSDTLKAIADYVGQQYTHGGDVRIMIEN